MIKERNMTIAHKLCSGLRIIHSVSGIRYTTAYGTLTVTIFMPKTLEPSPRPDPRKEYFDPDPTLPEM
jgi:hypothetical protein